MSADPIEPALSEGKRLADELHATLCALGDSGYVAGTVAARHPGKPVLGIRIPILRSAVRQALARSGQSAGVVRDLRPARP